MKVNAKTIGVIMFFAYLLSKVNFFILEFVRTTEMYLNKNTLFYRTVYLLLWWVVILSLKLMAKESEEGSILGVWLKLKMVNIVISQF